MGLRAYCKQRQPLSVLLLLLSGCLFFLPWLELFHFDVGSGLFFGVKQDIPFWYDKLMPPANTDSVYYQSGYQIMKGTFTRTRRYYDRHVQAAPIMYVMQQ